MALVPAREEPQVIYVERRRFSCVPSCGCCLLGLVTLLFGCALLTWFGLVALGLA